MENGHHEKLHFLRSTSRKANHSDISREKSNRHNEENGDRREIKKNMKYIYDYETTEVRTRRVSLRGQPEEAEPDERNDKEVKTNSVDEETPGRGSKNKARTKEPESNEMVNGEVEKEPLVNGDTSTRNTETRLKEENKETTVINGTIEEPLPKEKNQNKEEDADSESDQDIRRQRKRRRPNLNYMDDPRFSPRKTRSRKMSDSSDEDIRNQRYKYQLRQRKPKKPETSGNNMPLSAPVRRSDRTLPSLCVRRHRDRRHSSSDGSNYSEVETARSRKPNKNRNNNSAGNDGQLKSGPVGTAPAPIEPEILDKKDWLYNNLDGDDDDDNDDGIDMFEMPTPLPEVRFASVGGLDNHVRCLREMVLLPMMYPEIFRLFQIQPPRGVLFHGPPGTGKTLLARALANECSFGSRKVSFFMRKGADLLSKWVGESEKQLRLLFEQAAQMKPSIIFFDELDGLAPVRSSRQDQIHSSIVSTLLALMDGLDNRGEVIVIGATNRIDAIDPALRRPGRFDRELFFSLPARKEREDILRVHVSQWATPPNDKLMAHLAETSAGYCGSDLRALCTEAVIQSLRRTYPQVYTTDVRLQLDAALVKVEKQDFLRARNLLVPASCRVTQRVSRKLPAILEPLLRNPLDTVLRLFKDSFPHGLDPALANVKVSNSLHIAQLLLTGDTPAQGQSSYLAPALLHHMEHVNLYTLDLAALHKETARSAEETCIEVFNEARRNVPSVIYVPSIEQWWALVGETVRAIFLSQLSMLDPNIPILFLATANVEYKQLPEQISSIFSTYRKEVLHLSPPVTSQREAFFKPLITASLKPPKPPRARPKTPPPLPPAPTPSPPPIPEEQLKKIQDKEESTLTELRIFLRDMCKKLASNRMFYMFTKPVDLEEVPDYLSIIKEPMDLETMMTKVDLHRYCSAQEFLADIDLICNNALEYNPAKTSADKQIRHRACSLRDYAYALIKAEMDSDFEEQCRAISKKRKERRTNTDKFLPPFIYTAPDGTDETNLDGKDGIDGKHEESANNTSMKDQMDTSNNSSRLSPQRKRKVAMWARGYLGGKKRKRSSRHADAVQDESYKGNSQTKSSGDESKENKPEEGNEQKDNLDGSTISLPGSESTQSTDVHTPLTVNCDTEHSTKTVKTSPLSSNSSKKCTETLSPAIWPSFSDLLEDTAHLDDPELCEINERCAEDEKKVIVDQVELEKMLSYAVSVTKGCSVMALMDLYGQLNRVVAKYSRTYDRKTLPQELQRELYRFHDILKRPVTSTSRCTSSAS